MDRFLADAENILNTALNAMASGHRPTEMTILMGAGRQMQLLADCDWSRQSIRVERGASAAYRVTCRQSKVIVEGDQQGRNCRLEQSINLRTHLLSREVPCWVMAVPYAQRLLSPGLS